MTPEEVIARARSQIGLGTVYKLGGGKTVPSGSTCHDEFNGCDCSAFVCWVLKMRKYQGEEFWWLNKVNGGWYNTDGIWVDARGMAEDVGPLYTGCFTEIDEPKPGCIAVYPAEWISKIAGPEIGHIGIVTEVTDFANWKIIHCSSGNYRGFQDAIRETENNSFINKAALLFAWPSSVRPVEEV